MTINLFFWLLSGVDGTLPANMLGLFHLITIILRAERVRTESSFVHLNEKVGRTWFGLDSFRHKQILSVPTTGTFLQK